MRPTKYDPPVVSLSRRPLVPQLSGLLIPVVLAAEERRLFTESRQLYAVVAGLVLVAVALSLLTVGYWRRTKPVWPEPARARQAPAVPSGRTARQAVAGADHATVDDTWESHATGEHKRVVAPTSMARPGTAARRAALERSGQSAEPRR